MSGGLWGDAGIDVVRTLRKDELDRVTIGQCRRLQEHVFNPDPEWNGSVDTEQFIPKPVEALTSGADLEAEIDFVRQREPASSERWHIVRENGTVIAKAHTHTRQLRALASVATEGGERVEVCFTVLALTGVNVSPNTRGRGLGQLVTQAAFAQLSRVPQEAPKGGIIVSVSLCPSPWLSRAPTILLNLCSLDRKSTGMLPLPDRVGPAILPQAWLPSGRQSRDCATDRSRTYWKCTASLHG